METLQFLKTVNQSMLPKLNQLTMPADFAKKIKLRRCNPPTFVKIWCVHKYTGEDIWFEYPLKFRRQANRNGGWRADRKQWKHFVAEQGMETGDLVIFVVTRFDSERLEFEVKVWEKEYPPKRPRRRGAFTVKIEEEEEA